MSLLKHSHEAPEVSFPFVGDASLQLDPLVFSLHLLVSLIYRETQILPVLF